MYPRIGFDIPYNGHKDLISYYGSFGTQFVSPTCQIYLSTGNSYRTTFHPTDKENLKLYFATEEGNSKSFHIHTPLMLNLANLNKPNLIDLSISVLKKLLEQVHDLPCSAVLHFGATCKSGSTPVTVAEKLDQLFRSCSDTVRSRRQPVLLIENSASNGTKMGGSVDDFRRLFEVLDHSYPLGICIDTQHSFGAGVCSWDNKLMIDQYLDEFDSLKPKAVRLLHLNDSMVEYGSRTDRHESLCRGKIFRPGIQSNLADLLDSCLDRGIELICETPRQNYSVDWQQIVSILARNR